MTALDSFTVHTEHPWSPPGWIHVKVYDDPRSLSAAAQRYSPDFDHSETAACFQSAPLNVHVDDDGLVDIPDKTYAGVLRIRTDQGVATLAHEATHAACTMYLRQHAAMLDLTTEDAMDHEEVLCYAVGDLVGGVTAEMMKRGHW